MTFGGKEKKGGGRHKPAGVADQAQTALLLQNPLLFKNRGFLPLSPHSSKYYKTYLPQQPPAASSFIIVPTKKLPNRRGRSANSLTGICALSASADSAPDFLRKSGSSARLVSNQSSSSPSGELLILSKPTTSGSPRLKCNPAINPKEGENGTQRKNQTRT